VEGTLRKLHGEGRHERCVQVCSTNLDTVDTTIVIQPNIITGDERMGVQVGELLRVTSNGVESLHRYPMRFIQCG
jgi:hypothetical protein